MTRMAVGSSMLTTIRTAPPQWPQVLTSMLTKSPGAIWNSQKAGPKGRMPGVTRAWGAALKVIKRRFSFRLRWSLLAAVDVSSVGGRLPRPNGVSCARNFAFGAQIRLERI